MGRFEVRHVTTYRYRNLVAFGEHRLMLRPRRGFDQRVLRESVAIEPLPTRLTWAEDPAGNLVGSAAFGRRGRSLRFEGRCTVEVDPFLESDLRIADHARLCPFSYGAEEMPDLARFIERQHPDAAHAVDGFAREVLAQDRERDTWRFLGRLNAALRRDFGYLRREEAGIQRPDHTLRHRRGTCRDFALLMAEAVRALGLAARFVSGYLFVPSGEGPVRQAGGFTHAWIQVYLPGGGWIDFDPTSGAVGNRDLVRVAAVRDPASATPLSGSFMGFPSDCLGMEVDVQVERVAAAAASASASATAVAATSAAAASSCAA